MTRLIEIHVDNYRSLQNFSIDLQPLTILIGRNDAGKSSTLNIIRLLLDDQTTAHVNPHDWNRTAPATRYPRTVTITGVFESTQRLTLRRKITLPKTGTAISTLELLDGAAWRVLSQAEQQKIPTIYYLRPRTGALQEAFSPSIENNIFTLIKGWMPPTLSQERDLHKLMRRYDPTVTNLKAYTKFFEEKIYGALRIAFPSDFNVTLLQPEYRSLEDRGKLMVRELTHGTASKALFRLPLDHHGTGLTSVVAIVLTIAVLTEYHRQQLSSKPLLVAIEEPEVHLHPQAQRTFLNYIRWASQQTQILVTTHSPLFVDRSQPNNVVVLRRANQRDEKNSQKTTKPIRAGSTIVSTRDHTKNWQDIINTLGIRLSDALMAGEINLLVEGPTETILFPAMARALSKQLPYNIDRVLIVNGEGGGLPYTVKLLQATGNPTLVVVDNDKGGREASKQVEVQHYSDVHIMMPNVSKLPVPLNQLKDCEIEDLLDAQELLQAFNEAFQNISDYSFLPLSYADYQKEQMIRLGKGLPFGWIAVVGSLVKNNTSSPDIQKLPDEKVVSKRALAMVAAKYIENGKMKVPKFCEDVFTKIAQLLGD